LCRAVRGEGRSPNSSESLSDRASDLPAALPGFPKPRFAFHHRAVALWRLLLGFVAGMTIAIDVDEPHPIRDE